MKLSILDQVPISKGMTSTEALANAVKLAQLGDEQGYERIWFAEHHNTTSLASSAPEVTAAYIAAKTERIRVGTGGIMMMHYSPFKVAEVFKTLAALAPGRIDFGAGRAPGGDMPAMTALASGRRPDLTEQYDKLEVILRLMNEQRTGEAVYDNVVAVPFKVQLPQSWLLGSSGQSAKKPVKPVLAIHLPSSSMDKCQKEFLMRTATVSSHHTLWNNRKLLQLMLSV